MVKKKPSPWSTNERVVKRSCFSLSFLDESNNTVSARSLIEGISPLTIKMSPVKRESVSISPWASRSAISKNLHLLCLSIPVLLRSRLVHPNSKSVWYGREEESVSSKRLVRSDKLKQQQAKTYAVLLLSLLRLSKIQISKRVIILYTTGGVENEKNFLVLSGHLLYMRVCTHAWMYERARVCSRKGNGVVKGNPITYPFNTSLFVQKQLSLSFPIVICCPKKNVGLSSKVTRLAAERS